jgi:hypothetical protein
MIELHKESAYQATYSRYASIFVDAYCAHKLNGYSTQNAIAAARISLQITVTGELEFKDQDTIVLQAYENIKSDTELIRKAIEYFQGMKS